MAKVKIVSAKEKAAKVEKELDAERKAMTCADCPFVRPLETDKVHGHCFGFPPGMIVVPQSVNKTGDQLVVYTPEVRLASPACIIPFIKKQLDLERTRFFFSPVKR